VTTLSPTAWTLAWSDEFDRADGQSPDPVKWVFDLGGHGWGNQELQTYTHRKVNARIVDGCLLIEARQERWKGPDRITRRYTSARLKTANRLAFRYGKVEARILLPAGQGIWPAFWMLGVDTPGRPWPHTGEIDIMENIGSDTTVVFGTAHGPKDSGIFSLTAPYRLPPSQSFADDFHVFALEWEPDALRFFVDGNLYQTLTRVNVPAGGTWAFDHPFYLLLNVAVGGTWPGPPNTSTTFPQRMRVDYVRVYRR
jgi:beta-glucanase (GH16 family)